MNAFIEALQKRVLLSDGATGTLLQTMSINPKTDLLGKENCFEILNLTRPDLVEAVHRAYLEVGADCIKTNTFGANKIVLAEQECAEKVYDINVQSAKIARKMAHQFSTSAQPRFVLGSMGPGSKLPSLGHITYDKLVDSYSEQALGLLDGKIDAFLLETHQDLLTIKAAIQGCRLAKFERNDQKTPIFAQVTMEPSGTMLVGSTIDCVVTSLDAMDIEGIGLNCGTGPQEMLPYIQYLSSHWSKFISVMPNAGLPIVVDGKISYPLPPDDFTLWQERFVTEYGANLVGGCCGTSPKYIRAVRQCLDQRKRKQSKKRRPHAEPSIASLFQSIPLRQENAILLIGERTNANGSKQFRELLKTENWDGMIALAKAQVKEGSQAIDVCVAYTGRPEFHDMNTFISQCRAQVTVPLVIDSTHPEVIETSLKLLGGKSIINSINLEDETKARRILELAKQFGAAVIALTLDEQGMAKTFEEKIKIAEKLYDLAVNQYQLSPSDLFIDPLTFTVCTGMDADREQAMQTLKAIHHLSQQFPNSQIILGVSNISFGLKELPRQVLNSVFLHQAQTHGMTAAILHVSKILPLHKIPKLQQDAAENLIFNRWTPHGDPLLYFMSLFSEENKKTTPASLHQTVEARLTTHVIDGIKDELSLHLDEALKKYSALDIVNQILLPAMGRVGELFGCGDMQLPFVLQSAEVMKTAVQYLEKFLNGKDTPRKGTIVLATVQGDVHDIGKNLVDIILSNNGYHVVNIGIKKTIDEILEAARQYKADAVGMSGLLVQSTLVMKENLAEMQRRGVSFPVLLGGAALTRKFVEHDCRHAYTKNTVEYAEDAFAGLKIMSNLVRKG